MKSIIILSLLVFGLFFSSTTMAGSPGRILMEEPGMKEIQANSGFDSIQASHFARLALRCINQEFPNKPGHVMDDSTDVKSPRELYPAFYGCFDWHSAVHGHWMLVKLIREFPYLPEADTIRFLIDQNITAENIRVEVEYFEEESNKSFERTYGWAWLLKLAGELEKWDDPQGKVWLEAIDPLAKHIVQKYTEFLPRLTYPNRTGEHPNTAFGLSFAWDYADATNNAEFKKIIESKAREYYLDDRNCPGNYEPGGFDFLSPCLIEADLMSRILPEYEFLAWMNDFLPDFEYGTPEVLFIPATVSDRTDGKLVHLDGLNLSRSWCLYRISSFYPGENNLIRGAAHYHLEVTLPNISSGNYAGEHWLASFAVFAIYTGLDTRDQR